MPFSTYSRPPSGSSFSPYEVEMMTLPTLAGDATLPADVALTDYVIDVSPDSWLYLHIMNSDSAMSTMILENITAELHSTGDEYSVTLTEIGANRDNVIKVLRAILDIDLEATEELVDSTPHAIIMENVTAERADVMKMALETTGAIVEVVGGESIDSGLYNVVIVDVGTQKISLIKAVRVLTSLGLVDAKDIVEAAPNGVVLSGIGLEAAVAAQLELQAVGATVVLEELP